MPEANEVELVPSNEEWIKLVPHETNMITPTFEDFVQIDEDVVTAGEHTDDDIINNCVSSFTDGNNSEEEADGSEILDPEIRSIPKKQEALNALETLHQFFEYSAAVDKTIFDKIYELEKHVHNAKTETQKKVTDFFNVL